MQYIGTNKYSQCLFSTTLFSDENKAESEKNLNHLYLFFLFYWPVSFLISDENKAESDKVGEWTSNFYRSGWLSNFCQQFLQIRMIEQFLPAISTDPVGPKYRWLSNFYQKFLQIRMIERQKVAMEASPHLHVSLAPLTRVLKRSTLPKAALLNLPKSGFVF